MIKPVMTVEEAIQLARTKFNTLADYPSATFWRVACVVLADRVEYLQKIVDGEFPEGCTPADARVLREANHKLAEEVDRLRLDAQRLIDANEEYHGDALALEQERDELRRRVAELERSLKSVAEWLDGDTNSIARDVGIGVCSFNDIYRSTEHCIEKIINPALLNQIEGGQ